jgi:L-alanine-DL-glutamate epimerase-like enolase superfamily enzyme
VTENVILELDLDGTVGLGECVPRDYVTGETTASVCQAILERLDIDMLTDRVAASSFEACVRNVERLNLPALLGTARRAMPAAACAVELAILDALGRRFDRPMCDIPAALGLPQLLVRPENQRRSYKVSRVLDFTTSLPNSPSQTGLSHHIKIKVGQNLAHDIDRVRRARDMFGPDVSMSVDANMAWSMDDAVSMEEQLRSSAIDWYEEPLRDNDIEQLRRFRDLTGAAVMLDEAFSSIDDAQRAFEGGACDLLNIRLSKCGGFLPSLRLVEFCVSNSVRFQIGVQVGEAGPLWAAGRHFVGAIQGAAAYEAGQGDRLFNEPLIAPQPEIDLRTYLAEALPGPGLGVSIVADVLSQHTIERYELGHRGGARLPIGIPGSPTGLTSGEAPASSAI